ncbi:MAG: DUF465 domain-containing protein [Pseudomonadota bacterium]
MTIQSRIETLEQKHEQLEEELAALTQAPSVSDLHLSDVKRRKLELKDEIARLKSAATEQA